MTQMVQPIWYDNVKISVPLEMLSTGTDLLRQLRGSAKREPWS